MSEINVLNNLVNKEYNRNEATSLCEDNIILWKDRYDNLSISKVYDMIEQGTDKEASLDKAIEILLENPFIAKNRDSDLLNLVLGRISSGDILRGNNHKRLLIIYELLGDNIDDYEYSGDLHKSRMLQSVKRLKNLLYCK